VLLQQEEGQAEVPPLRRVDVAAMTYHWFDDIRLPYKDAFPAQVFRAHATTMVCKLVSDNALYPMEIKPMADAVRGTPEREDLFKAVIQMAEPNTEWADCLDARDKSDIAKCLLEIGFKDVVSNTDYDQPYVPVSVLNAMLDNAKFPAKDITMVANLWHRLTANVVSGYHGHGDYSAFLVRMILLSCGSDTERYERPRSTGGMLLTEHQNPSDATVCFNLAALSFVGRRAEEFVLLAGDGRHTRIDVESVQSILHRCARGVLAMKRCVWPIGRQSCFVVAQRRCEVLLSALFSLLASSPTTGSANTDPEKIARAIRRIDSRQRGENPKAWSTVLPEFFNAICANVAHFTGDGPGVHRHPRMQRFMRGDGLSRSSRAFIRKMVVESTFEPRPSLLQMCKVHTIRIAPLNHISAGVRTETLASDLESDTSESPSAGAHNDPVDPNILEYTYGDQESLEEMESGEVEEQSDDESEEEGDITVDRSSVVRPVPPSPSEFLRKFAMTAERWDLPDMIEGPPFWGT
jgi:hypothetical protein